MGTTLIAPLSERERGVCYTPSGVGRAHGVPGGSLLVGVGHLEDRGVPTGSARHLEPDG